MSEFQALGDLFAHLLGARLAHLLFEILDRIRKIDLAEDVADGLGAHSDAEGVCTVLFFGFAQFHFGQQLTALHRSVAWVDDHVVLVIDHALQRACGHIEHEADAAWHALVEPDVRDGHCELDVAHALTTHAAQGDLDAAAIADHALVLDALVFSASTLPVLGRTEDSLTEKAALFRFECAVVDRFGVFHFP